MQASLVMVKADGTSKEVPIDRDVFTIGREATNRLRIPVASVSRNHCELTKDDGELLITDKGSSNGTFVNGKRVKETELAPGDLVSIGPVVFVVRVDGHPREIDAKDSYAAGSVVEGESDGSSMAPAPTTRSTSITSPASAAAKPPAPAGGPAAKGKGDDDDDDRPLSDLLKDFDFGDDEDDDEPKKK